MPTRPAPALALRATATKRGQNASQIELATRPSRRGTLDVSNHWTLAEPSTHQRHQPHGGENKEDERALLPRLPIPNTQRPFRPTYHPSAVVQPRAVIPSLFNRPRKMTAVSGAPAASSKSDDGSQGMTPLSPTMKMAIGALMLSSFLDALGMMVIIPTLAFYIRELGGTNAQYGQVMASGSLAAFIATPLYGSWIDARGGEYRKCWFFGYYAMVTANVIFALAVVLHGDTAVYTVLFSRLLYGLGSSSGSTFMTWISEVLDPSQLSFCIYMFSVASNSGAIMGPFVNTIFGELRVEADVFGLKVPIDSKNGAGLLIAALDVISWILIYFFVPDPPTKRAAPVSDGSSSEGASPEGPTGWAAVFKEFGSFKVFMPAFAIFVCTANWQIIETAFAPVTLGEIFLRMFCRLVLVDSSCHHSDALGWGTVQVSAVLGFNSILNMAMTALAAILVQYLSDTTMVVSGFFCWFVAGLMMVREVTIFETHSKRTHWKLFLNRIIGGSMVLRHGDLSSPPS